MDWLVSRGNMGELIIDFDDMFFWGPVPHHEQTFVMRMIQHRTDSVVDKNSFVFHWRYSRGYPTKELGERNADLVEVFPSAKIIADWVILSPADFAVIKMSV